MEDYTPILEKDKKTFSFKRTIQDKQKKSSHIFSFTIIKSEEGIEIKIKEEKENFNFGASNYGKKYSYNDLKKISRYFEFLKTLDLIFESLKKNFDNKKDIISLENQYIEIKFKINIDILEEEIKLHIPQVKEENKEEMMEKLKNSLNFLNNENSNLKEEMKIMMENDTYLNETVNELKKELKEMSKYIKEKLNPNEKEEKELKTYYCERKIIEKEKEKTNIMNRETIRSPDGNNIFENNLIFGINILLFEEIIKIKINRIQDNLKSNLLFYESSFYLRDFKNFGEYYTKNGGIKSFYKFLCDLFENKKDSIKTDGDDKVIINFKFPWGLQQEKISLVILSKDLGLDKTLNNLKQSIEVLNKENKNLKSKLNEKLTNEINNINQTVYNEINEVKSDTYKLKIEFQRDLLERVYPVGSYYWSSNNISPEELFGGKWEQIYGRFLFATDNQHPIGTEGGEESHILTINEMPCHSHKYEKTENTKYDGFVAVEQKYDSSYKCPYNNNKLFIDSFKIYNYYNFNYIFNDNFHNGNYTGNSGSGNAHNNMPPYLSAFCWRRTS